MGTESRSTLRFAAANRSFAGRAFWLRRFLASSLRASLSTAIRKGFPGLADDDIKAAIEFAKQSVEATELATLRD